MPVEGLRRDRRIVGAHHRIVAEWRDDVRPVGGGESRKRRDVEVVVVPVRDQHGVDRRQRVEGDPGIVDPLRSGKARRGTVRPH